MPRDEVGNSDKLAFKEIIYHLLGCPTDPSCVDALGTEIKYISICIFEQHDPSDGFCVLSRLRVPPHDGNPAPPMFSLLPKSQDVWVTYAIDKARVEPFFAAVTIEVR